MEPHVLAKTKRFLTDNSGSALVEGALIIPVLFVLMYGVYEFSWYFHQQQLVSSGVRDAARYLARLPASCNTAAPVWLEHEAMAKNLAVTGQIDGGLPRVSGWTTRMVAVNCSLVPNAIGPNGLRAFRGGPFVYVVTVSTHFSETSLGFFHLLHVSIPFIAMSHSERVIGPG
jgi:Flp pilus assembly protein TadG